MIIDKDRVYLFDSDILVYGIDATSPYFSRSVTLRQLVQRGELRGVIAIQNLLEFYAAVTNPNIVAAPLTPSEAYKEIQNYEAVFHLIHGRKGGFRLFLLLLGKYQPKGSRIHDLRLVSTMLENGVFHMMTFRDKDYTEFKEITPYNPNRLEFPGAASNSTSEP